MQGSTPCLIVVTVPAETDHGFRSMPINDHLSEMDGPTASACGRLVTHAKCRRDELRRRR